MDSAQAECVADAVASAFGLGAVLGEWEPVLGGRSHRSWRLTTVRGEWIVKRLNRSREPWWLAWHGWLAESPVEIEPGFVHAVGDYLPDIARATEIAADAAAQLGTTLDLVFTHRDVKPDNILCTPTSPLLVDFDGAGLDVAQWEITRAALAFARTPSGWDHDHARRILRAYRAADGYPVSADPAAFAGLLRSRLGGASWMLFRALGHRPVTGPERAAAREHVLELLADLRGSLRRIEEWTTLLA
ncbi:phosphotransferase [Actinoalloteichus hymeniacidonis]|uniref:Phosphotransferase family protein n=1 Tax=Actinoalloteichus hymeniacidonis TaxID=340345 RepID=A0AAC9HR87_9PSEU|nr:phosphotransferase [Actinoalloteichus hymeniacidonis]AOS64152.1 phosphotransferase family protein [Actinoalloteichus hymeniacidonis]MBB5907782.1 Ser/Thr protein kinase RdoA (MazF antagonist) [Actinoalloteichus hymeniacidonis]